MSTRDLHAVIYLLRYVARNGNCGPRQRRIAKRLLGVLS